MRADAPRFAQNAFVLKQTFQKNDADFRVGQIFVNELIFQVNCAAELALFSFGG
jgi:carbohydrate-selective porin OprB